MQTPMTRDQGRAFRERWELVRAVQLKELQAASPASKLRRLAALMASARQLGWSEELRAGEAGVRERWIRLKKACGVWNV